MNLNEPLGLSIKGEGAPYIPTPGDKTWSALSLPWMAYGYGSIQITPLQTLTFYNAVANGGVMVKPRFIKEIKEWDKTIVKNELTVINPSIASPETISKVQEMLKNVVEKGTAKSLYSPNFSMAGKTGTAQTEYWMEDWQSNRRYISSFVGYFPAEDPKYTSIVIIHKPKVSTGYYGADVSGPVFKRIAQKIYTDTPVEDEIESLDIKNEIISQDFEKYYTTSQDEKRLMPDVKGMPVMDAMSILENLGLDVQVNGNGYVQDQSIAPGEKIKLKQKVALKLS
jgi:cell division protein FtsI (penicillin-binding protein 3)